MDFGERVFGGDPRLFPFRLPDLEFDPEDPDLRRRDPEPDLPDREPEPLHHDLWYDFDL